jgi:hypothetical protein
MSGDAGPLLPARGRGNVSILPDAPPEVGIVFGVSVVLLVWADGHIRIPLAFRVWHKGGHQSMCWPWSCSVMRGIGSSVSRNWCCVTRGTPPEAVVSSQIEGTQATMGAVLEYAL